MKLNTQCLKSPFVAALILITASAAFAQRPGDLVITPTRVQLDERVKSGDLTLLNRGAKPVRYRLSLINMEMSEDGVLKRRESDDPLSAVPSLRLSPREILLEPGVSQRVRIAAAVPAGTQDGELRSHLVFEPMSMPSSNAASPDTSGSLRINLEFRSVVSIPVIVRHGSVAASGSMSDLSVLKDPQGYITRFTIHRAGNRSLRGNVTATFIPASGGSQLPLGEIAGLSVYCPNSDRIVNLRLKNDLSKLGAGKIVVRFAEQEHSRGAVDLQAQITAPG